MAGQRSTRQRAAIEGVLADVEGFLSAQELHELLRQRGAAVGLTTVYRALQAMTDAGDVDALVSADGETVYRRCGQRGHHHHHLVCRRCGLTAEVVAPTVEDWTQAIAREHGFTDVHHTLEIFGLCPACSSQAS
jgi:Fur family transcriptional regulator, ferric uptake regulator